ncbi:Glycosyl transferase, family 2 [Rhodopseudomonas palustris HaA2]|uniref:Glycosyl transferase, family 2 n=1 Tax=Rhodopseudomonas palustris (strain HaA2) TaxID=316058 RepID=Q2IZV7_RHOP2|nr:glycosyltransferase family 2 protein [Rhodopseudomonas palustris]ABD06253.1 Glycosyl transferase, family 2 [Rhodopseudomonas palustris HaA2]
MRDPGQAPSLSIVTVTYNSAATLSDTLNSVRSQTFRDFEHIVVDGGSTDGTLDILNAAGSSVRWISEPDKGIYDAMNKGIGMARGRWIHLLNSDDYYASDDVLARIVPKLKEDAVNYCDLIRADANGGRVVQRFPFRKWPLYFSAYLPHPSLVVSAAQYGAVGTYDVGFRVAADHDMILRLVDRFPANHIPVEMTVMRQDGVSATNLDLSMREFGMVLQKHRLPEPLITAIMAIRRIWWRLRSNERS